MTQGSRTPESGPALTNWAGNHAYRTTGLREPRSIEELQGLVRDARHVRALGTRHAFNDLADTPGELASLRSLPRRFDLDPEQSTLTVDGGTTYGELCGPLDRAGFALQNLASLAHISVGGACATATHGSGSRYGSLATSVVALTLVRADGELVRVAKAGAPGGAQAPREAPVQGVVSGAELPLDAAVVSLGALGVVVAITLKVEPAYDVRQDVVEGLSFETFTHGFDEIFASADSVSCFTDWSSPTFHQVWRKQRIDRRNGSGPPEPIAGTTRASEPLHPIRGYPAEACTAQLGVAGAWHERLPHFRLDHRPSAGAELQSEYAVRRDDAPDAVAALARLADRLAPVTLVSEIRTVAADGDWLSLASGRDSATIHFTWKPSWPAVRDVLRDVERALRPFEPRPHWAKLFTLAAEDVLERYPDRSRFTALAEQLDPDGKFRNAFLDAWVFDATA